MQINEVVDLEQLRVTAKISQAEMAEHLGVSQSQVSRYERDPDEVPHKIIRKWVEFCGYVASSKGIDVGMPFAEIQERVQLMLDYAQTEPEPIDGESSRHIPITATEFLEGVFTVARKPRIGVLGRFDMGKSRLCNVLLGGDRLPTSYQPATSVICLIRHVSDKPSWQAEDVWMMSKGFSLDQADSEDHCLQHRLFAGGFEALKQYGTHTGSGIEHKAFAAVAYVDAPILLGCDMVDLPGYGHSDDDQDRAEMAHKMVDVMLYLSTAVGFLDQNDLNYLSVLLRHLPTYEGHGAVNEPLRNLMVVATRADMAGSQIDSILDMSANRAFRHLDNAIEEREKITGVHISQENFRRRFFTFTADNPAMREGFESDLKDLLINVLPSYTLKRLNFHVQEAKSAATRQCNQWIHRLELALDEREKAQAAIQEIDAQEPERLRKKAAHEQRIVTLVGELKNDSREIVTRAFDEEVSVEAIEAMIRRRYDNKKDAQQLAGAYLLDSVQKKIADSVTVKAERFAEDVDSFLGEYQVSIGESEFLQGGWDFNARATFMGALAGIGTFGALATWVSVAAAGSNLGAYLLIPSVVSFLSSIGIGVGGTSAAVSLVSTLGGPITIGIAIAVGIGLLVASLFGDSWQKKLAKKIRESVLEQGAKGKILSSIDKYWDDTKLAFVQAAAETEAVYQSKLKSLRILAFDTNQATVEAELKFAKETRDFFGGMPWRAVRG